MNETVRRQTKINILSCANRYGKSTLIACLQLWYLFYKFGIPPGNGDAWEKAEYRTANIAPHSASTEPVFKTIEQILTSRFPIRQPDGSIVPNECLIEWFYIKERTLNTPPYKQFFANNSYIEHRSLGADQGGALQGKPYGLITYDEGGRSDHLEYEMNDAIRPRLFDWRGPLHIISTPSQDSKSTLYYYELYQDGLVGIHSTYTQEGSLRDNTFFSEEQIEEQYELEKDNPLRDQVLEGKFVFGGGAIFDGQSIFDAMDATLDDGIRHEEGHKYVIGTDTAIGSDEMVYQVIDFTAKPFRLVRQIACKGNSKSPQQHLNDFVDLFDSYNKEGLVFHMLETYNGESVRFYHDLPPYIQSVTLCYGTWVPVKHNTDNQNPTKSTTAAAKKSDILVSLKKLLEARELKIPKKELGNRKLSQQIQIYREDDKRLQTDRLIALALACKRASDLAPMASPNWQSYEW